MSTAFRTSHGREPGRARRRLRVHPRFGLPLGNKHLPVILGWETPAAGDRSQTCQEVVEIANPRCLAIKKYGRASPGMNGSENPTPVTGAPNCCYLPPTAFTTAAFANRRVESRVGSGDESGVT